MSAPLTLTFLGTGTSMGVPVAGGFGSEGSGRDPRDERYRTAAWVRTETASIVIDIGPEFRLQTLRSGIRQIDQVLITHEHTDHIGGLDDLRPFNYIQEAPIPVVTHARTQECIRTRFAYMFEPGKTPGSVDLDFLPVRRHVCGDVEITPLPVTHGRLEILGFRLNDLVYITDANRIPDATMDLCQGADVLVLNGLRWEPEHPTHFTIPEAVEVAKRIGARQTWFVHMSSQVRHSDINRRLPEGMALAYDQLVVSVGGRRPSP